MIPILLFIVVISASTSATQEACGSQSDVLFRSNAYLDSIVPSSGVGGTVLQTQEEWSVFLHEFSPNYYGEALERTSIDFTAEKVVVGSYYTTSTCQVTISQAQLYCSTSDEGTVQMTMKMDVVDASLDCNLQCMALGQVLFAIAVPTDWNIDEDTGYEINVTGPCVNRSPSESPVEILLDTTTTTTEATTFDSSSKSDEFDRDDIDYSETSSTEPATYEKSQLQSTVSTQDIIIEEVVIPDSEIPVIEIDTTTTTTPATITETTTVATEPVISIDGTPTASPTVKAEDSSSSSFQPQLWKLALLLLSSACFLDIIECTIS